MLGFACGRSGFGLVVGFVVCDLEGCLVVVALRGVGII